MLQSETTDLVLTNVYLHGISGHDAMRRLRVEYPKIRVLMVAGVPDEKSISEWTGEPRFDIFPKPFNLDTLVLKVREMLEIPI